jgi:uncharacterized DUF497 family protein
MRLVEFSGFDWDAGNREKCHKHGVSPREIEELFLGAPRVALSPRSDVQEERFIAIGRSKASRPIFVAFTFRLKHGRRLIRPISARYMHRKEVDAYDAQGS